MFFMSAAFLPLPKTALEKAFLFVYLSFALPSVHPPLPEIFTLRRFVILSREFSSNGGITESMVG